MTQKNDPRIFTNWLEFNENIDQIELACPFNAHIIRRNEPEDHVRVDDLKISSGAIQLFTSFGQITVNKKNFIKFKIKSKQE